MGSSTGIYLDILRLLMAQKDDDSCECALFTKTLPHAQELRLLSGRGLEKDTAQARHLSVMEASAKTSAVCMKVIEFHRSSTTEARTIVRTQRRFEETVGFSIETKQNKSSTVKRMSKD